MVIDEKTQEGLSEISQKVIELLDGLSYFESVLVLEMTRDVLRIDWMIDSNKSMKEDKKDE